MDKKTKQALESMLSQVKAMRAGATKTTNTEPPKKAQAKTPNDVGMDVAATRKAVAARRLAREAEAAEGRLTAKIANQSSPLAALAFTKDMSKGRK